MTDEIGGHLANFDQMTVSGSVPAVDSASREHSQIWIVDAERIGTATYSAIYTSNRYLEAWNETVSFDGKRIREFFENHQYYTDELVREEDNLYLVRVDYRGSSSPKNNPTAFRPIESLAVSAPEKSIEDVYVIFSAPAGNPRQEDQWDIDILKSGYPNIDNYFTALAGTLQFTDKSEAEFPTVLSGEFSIFCRNYSSTALTFADGAYQVRVRKAGTPYETYLVSEQFIVNANSLIQVNFIANPLSINFEANETLEFEFGDATNNTNVHAIGGPDSSFAVIVDVIEAEADALSMDAKSDIVMDDRKNDVQYPVVNTQGFLGKYKAEVDSGKITLWNPGTYVPYQIVLFDDELHRAKTAIVPADGDPLISNKWQPIYAQSRPYDEDNFAPVDYNILLWGSSELVASYRAEIPGGRTDPHNSITVEISGSYLYIRANVKITALTFTGARGTAILKNNTTTATTVNDLGFFGDLVFSGSTTSDIATQQEIADTDTALPITVPARDPLVANSGEIDASFDFTNTDTPIVFEEMEIGDIERLYFEADPILSSDLELLFRGFSVDFSVEGEVDHPNGDTTLVETDPSERALRTYFYLGDDIIANYKTLVVGLERHNADVTVRNSYQDLFIDLGSLRRNVETTKAGGLKSGPGYIGYDYTLSPGDEFTLTFHDGNVNVRESLESEAANQPPTGELNYIHDLNPIGGFNRYQYYIGGAYYHTDGRIWIIHDHASGLFSMDPNTGRVEQRSATSILQWGGGNLQDPSGLSYDDSDGKFMIMYHHQTDNNYRIQKVEPGNTNNSQFGTEQSERHYGLQKVGNLWYSLRVVGTTTSLISIDSAGQFSVERDLGTNIGACALTFDPTYGDDGRFIAASRATDRIYSFDRATEMVAPHGSAFDSNLTIGGIVYIGDENTQRTIAISNNNSTPGKRNKAYDVPHRTGPARRVRTVIARR